MRRCEWEGCHEVALPMPVASGQYWCSQHLAQAHVMVVQATRETQAAIQRREALAQTLGTPAIETTLATPKPKPWYRKPGRIVPWLLMLPIINFTFGFTTMAFWWCVLIPVIVVMWHFGAAQTADRWASKHPPRDTYNGPGGFPTLPQ
jgi:hypothetical protein